MRWDIEPSSEQVDEDHDLTGVRGQHILAQGTLIPLRASRCQKSLHNEGLNIHCGDGQYIPRRNQGKTLVTLIAFVVSITNIVLYGSINSLSFLWLDFSQRHCDGEWRRTRMGFGNGGDC